MGSKKPEVSVVQSLPEFSYRLELRNANGVPCSSWTMQVTNYTRGIVPVHPPHSGVDYYVDIVQMKGDEPTGIRAQLGIYVSEQRILLFRIAHTDVGFVTISAEEVTNETVPRSFEGATKASVDLPEKSTRFALDFD